MTDAAHLRAPDPIADLAPEARVRLEVFWEIVKRMNPTTAEDWAAVRQQTLLTETMILDGAGNMAVQPRPGWKPVAPDLVATIERMARAGRSTGDIRRETGLAKSTIRCMVRRKKWKAAGQSVAAPAVETVPEPAAAAVPPASPPARQVEQPAAEVEPTASVRPVALQRRSGKLSADDLVVIRRRVEAGEPQGAIAKDYGVTEAAIYHRARSGGWNVPSRRRSPQASPVSRETSGLSGNGIATKNKIRAAAMAAGVSLHRPASGKPSGHLADETAQKLRNAGHRLTRLPLEGKWRVDDLEPMTLAELERFAGQVAP